MDKIQGDGYASHTDDAPASSSQEASKYPNLSRANNSSGAAIFALCQHQYLEGQIATLLHHIKPWMQKLIFEFEERVEKMMEAETYQRV